MSDTRTATILPVASLTPFSLSLPIAMGYVPLGAVFGFLLIKAGAAWWLAPLISIFVYAGAAQYMAIPMMAMGVSYGAIALATLVVNLRHAFYGLSMLGRMPAGRLSRAYLVWSLTDETYSVLSALPRETPAGKLVAIAMLNHGWWVLGSTLGALIGARAQISLQGMDFSLAALFAVLAVEQWLGTRASRPVMIALLAYLLARCLFPAQALVVSIALCVAAGCLQKTPALRKNQND
jgi:4-azaleucine resistance transporter AzlC